MVLLDGAAATGRRQAACLVGLRFCSLILLLLLRHEKLSKTAHLADGLEPVPPSLDPEVLVEQGAVEIVYARNSA
jgi:hypothetical protein